VIGNQKKGLTNHKLNLFNNNMFDDLTEMVSERPWEAAFWLLLLLAFAVFYWMCWKNIKKN